MKKIKLVTGLVGATALSASLVPAITGCSCNKVNLENIKIINKPTKLNYVEGQKLELDGLEVHAVYSDGKEEAIQDYTTEPAVGTLLTKDINEVKVGYKGKTVSFNIQVEAKVITKLEITTLPTKTGYVVNQTLDLAGLVVTATYNDGTSSPITDYTTSPAKGQTLTLEDKKVIVTSEGKTAEFNISVYGSQEELEWENAWAELLNANSFTLENFYQGTSTSLSYFVIEKNGNQIYADGTNYSKWTKQNNREISFNNDGIILNSYICSDEQAQVKFYKSHTLKEAFKEVAPFDQWTYDSESKTYSYTSGWYTYKVTIDSEHITKISWMILSYVLDYVPSNINKTTITNLPTIIESPTTDLVWDATNTKATKTINSGASGWTTNNTLIFKVKLPDTLPTQKNWTFTMEDKDGKAIQFKDPAYGGTSYYVTPCSESEKHDPWVATLKNAEGEASNVGVKGEFSTETIALTEGDTLYFTIQLGEAIAADTEIKATIALS